MINFTDKSDDLIGLIVEVVESSGYWIKQSDNDWVSSDDVAVQAIADTFDPLIYAQNKAVTQIKVRAGVLIIAKLPEWKQRNLMAETLAIMNSATPDVNRLTEIELLWQYPKDIRAQSDIEEAKILSEIDWTLVIADFSAMEAI